MRWFRKTRAGLGGPVRRSLLTTVPRRRRRKRSRVWGWLGGVVVAAGIVAYWYFVFGVMDPADERTGSPASRLERATGPVVAAEPKPPPREPVDPSAILRDFVHRTARGMLLGGVRWEGGYTPLRYPGGDVPRDRGTSVDILIRALRGANIDLQLLIHEDRLLHPEHYPLHRWKQSEPDPSIDHRRLANVWAFFNRYAVRMDAGVGPQALETYQPGDVVFWGEGKMESPSHVGIVDDRRSRDGVPYVIDLDRDERELRSDHLLTYRPIMGHFRVDAERLPLPRKRTRASRSTEP